MVPMLEAIAEQHRNTHKTITITRKTAPSV